MHSEHVTPELFLPPLYVSTPWIVHSGLRLIMDCLLPFPGEARVPSPHFPLRCDFVLSRELQLLPFIFLRTLQASLIIFIARPIKYSEEKGLLGMLALLSHLLYRLSKLSVCELFLIMALACAFPNQEGTATSGSLFFPTSLCLPPSFTLSIPPPPPSPLPFLLFRQGLRS